MKRIFLALLLAASFSAHAMEPQESWGPVQYDSGLKQLEAYHSLIKSNGWHTLTRVTKHLRTDAIDASITRWFREDNGMERHHYDIVADPSVVARLEERIANYELIMKAKRE